MMSAIEDYFVGKEDELPHVEPVIEKSMGVIELIDEDDFPQTQNLHTLKEDYSMPVKRNKMGSDQISLIPEAQGPLF
eukprot:CAMPEP_0170544516 /NCGR_PEP_ID=MMETSP0211-20121228/3244_1 /TAXON_ID=311385 /ORGANISM="Pseudokeronopsis sp., Strain OXSARD2" /LENGTH=76 /DNA_ID=CAMNT_0010848177 /DNA_START=1616 /DNA_END=1846 /DNA_ORIENTATION=-